MKDRKQKRSITSRRILTGQIVIAPAHSECAVCKRWPNVNAEMIRLDGPSNQSQIICRHCYERIAVKGAMFEPRVPIVKQTISKTSSRLLKKTGEKRQTGVVVNNVRELFAMIPTAKFAA